LESIGDKLRETREELKLSLKDVASETQINPSYIEALETEDFERFPAEAYLIGFLKSYASFLKLDPEEIVQAYKGYKIGESVTPLEELTKPTKISFSAFFLNFLERNKNVIFILILIIIIFVLSFAGFKIYNSSVDISGNTTEIERIKNESNLENNKKNEVTSFQLHNDKGVGVIKKGEVVQFLVGNREVVFSVTEVGTDKVTILMNPEQKVEVLNLDKKRLVESSLSSRELFFTLKAVIGESATVSIELGKKNSNIEIDKIVKNEQKATTEVIARNKKNLKIVFDAEFTQKCFVELYLDGEHKPMRMFRTGEHVRWEASEFIQIRVGNAGAMKWRDVISWI